MANALFDAGREAFLDGDIDWLVDTFKVSLIDHADDTPNVSTDNMYDDIEAGEVAESSAMTTTTPSGTGVADASDVTLSAVTGDPAESMVIWKDTAGASSTDPLVVYIDTTSPAMPVTPNGGDITIAWSNDTNRIFKL